MGGHLSDKPPTRLAGTGSWPFEDFSKKYPAIGPGTRTNDAGGAAQRG
jgi:hypothetical protein